MDIITVRSLFTVLVLAVFLGIWIWAWSAKRKPDFEEAARLPFADDDLAQSAEESSHE
ncbi:MAG TPA: cbb3-type cytochrome c oxidase subunit 3 [Gammaproteobacteria bacterium]|nr:cbb3-type cytochrome c oxidase subunit 3 [Gammaproteobacteria bacterium]